MPVSSTQLCAELGFPRESRLLMKPKDKAEEGLRRVWLGPGVCALETALISAVFILAGFGPVLLGLVFLVQNWPFPVNCDPCKVSISSVEVSTTW